MSIAKQREPVIISCAVTGSVHTPSMSEHLPITPDEIAEASIGAAEAGAAILHLHARNPEDGSPTPDPEVFMAFLPRIKQATDAVVNITTGGGMNMTVDDRLEAPLRASPEMCSLNLGSMNFALYPMAEKDRAWKHDWEKPFLERTKGGIFKNTFEDIETILQRLGRERGARFEFECYDHGHIYSLAHLMDRGIVDGTVFVQFVLGILGGIGAEPESLLQMKQTADRLLGDSYTFSVAAAGRNQLAMTTMSAIMGGHVRVGLEDNLYLERGRLAISNAEQVTRIRQILEALSIDIATPDQARERLGLKGGDRVEF